MTLDARRRAKKQTRKATKRKARLEHHHRSGGGSTVSQTVQARVATWPVHQSYMPEGLFDTGIGNVVISRKMGVEIAVGVFLVDMFCLGVKDAFLSVLSAEEYELLLNRLRDRDPLVSIKPECARKLTEGAVGYAADLGFKPHRDYHEAKAIFGAIDTTLCETAFQFGKEGKPFYLSGPFESPVRRDQIVDTLRKRCGPDGFRYVVGLDDSDVDEADDDAVDDSDE